MKTVATCFNFLCTTKLIKGKASLPRVNRRNGKKNKNRKGKERRHIYVNAIIVHKILQNHICLDKSLILQIDITHSEFRLLSLQNNHHAMRLTQTGHIYCYIFVYRL